MTSTPPPSLLLDGGEQVLACPCSTRFGERAALLAWRPPHARMWDSDDLTLASSIGGIVRIVLEHEAIQRELARQARTDPLTGLLNRRAFIEEASRRLDRLERDGQFGTLLFLDLDHLKQLNDRLGHEAGDSALLTVSALPPAHLPPPPTSSPASAVTNSPSGSTAPTPSPPPSAPKVSASPCPTKWPTSPKASPTA